MKKKKYLNKPIIGLGFLRSIVLVAIQVLCFLGFLSLSASENALRLYSAGLYDQAYDVYCALEPKTSDIWYNIGNCAYKKGDSITALISWERAIASDPTHYQQDAHSNIDFVTRQSGFSYPFPESSWSDVLAHLVPLGVWQLLVLLVWYVLCLFLMRGYKNYVYLVGLLLAFLFTGYGGLQSYTIMHRKRGRVIANQSCLLLAPYKNVTQITTLEYLAPLTILEMGGSWYKAAYKDVRGWIVIDDVRLV